MGECYIYNVRQKDVEARSNPAPRTSAEMQTRGLLGVEASFFVPTDCALRLEIARPTLGIHEEGKPLKAIGLGDLLQVRGTHLIYIVIQVTPLGCN